MLLLVPAAAAAAGPSQETNSTGGGSASAGDLWAGSDGTAAVAAVAGRLRKGRGSLTVESVAAGETRALDEMCGADVLVRAALFSSRDRGRTGEYRKGRDRLLWELNRPEAS